MIEEVLTWRTEQKIDDLAAKEFPKHADFVRAWPHGLHGVSRDGHVLYIDRPGLMDPAYFAANFTMEEYMSMHIQFMEWMAEAKRRLSAKLETPRYKHVVILDLTNFGMSHFGSRVREPIKKLINIDSTKYPETLHQMYVVNPSFMFRAIWTIVSPLLDDSTKSRIIFLKDIKKLQEFVDPDQLPDFLGGNVKYDDDNRPFTKDLKTLAVENNHDDVFAGLYDAVKERTAKLATVRAELKKSAEGGDVSATTAAVSVENSSDATAAVAEDNDNEKVSATDSIEKELAGTTIEGETA